MEFKVLKHYNMDLLGITKAIICTDNSLLLCSSKYRSLKHILPSEGEMKEANTLKLWFIDIVQSSTGDLIYSTEDSTLKLLQDGTGIDISQFKVNRGRIVTIHLNEERKQVVLGVCMSEFHESGQVIVMDESGRDEAIYQYGNRGTWLFSNIGSISSYKDNIAVVDQGDLHRKDNSGSVTIINHGQQKVINVYKGHLDTYKTGYHPFRPHDIVLTKSNKFIVSDTCLYNPILHILDTEGQFLTFCNTKEELGISLPYFLAVDKNGLLYVGSQTYKGDNHTNVYVVQVDNI